MDAPYRLVLLPDAWRGQLSALSRDGRQGVAKLVRNDHRDARELVARTIRPRGESFSATDPILLVDLRDEVKPGDAIETLIRAQGGGDGPPLVASLVLGQGPSAGQWDGLVREHGRIRPLHGLRLVGPGMRDVPEPAASNRSVEMPPTALVGSLGPEVWARLRRSRVGVVGSGRCGSGVALALARLGVGGLVLVDPDIDECGTPTPTRWPPARTNSGVRRS